MPSALAPMVDEAMRGVEFSSLTHLAVTTGPGTFTGQRVGLAFMRGLRLALQIPADRRHHFGSHCAGRDERKWKAQSRRHP